MNQKDIIKQENPNWTHLRWDSYWWSNHNVYIVAHHDSSFVGFLFGNPTCYRVSIYLYNQDRSSYERILVTSGCSSSEDSKSFATELSCGLSTKDWNYSLSQENCEHFVTECVIEIPHSFQIAGLRMVP